MILQCESFVGFLDFVVSGISINFQGFVVVFLFRFFFFLLRSFDLLTQVDAGVQFLDFGIIHDGSSILSSLHVEIGSPDQGLIVVGIELQRFVEVIQSFECFLTLHEGQCSVRIDDCIQFLIGRVQIDCFSILLLGLFEFARLNEFVSFFLQLLTLLGVVQGQPALLVVGVQSHAFSEIFLSSCTLTAIQFDDALQVPEVGALLVQTHSNGLNQGEGFSGVSCLSQALNFVLLQFFAGRHLLNQIIDAGKSLSEVVGFNGSEVAIVVGLETLSFFELVADCHFPFDFECSFEGTDGLIESENLLAGKSLSPECLGEVRLDVDAGFAIGNALEVLSEVVVRSCPIGVEAVVGRIKLDGFGVCLDGLLEVLGSEGRVALLLPVLR